MIGGWDEFYKSPHIVDWDFFMKLEMLGVKGYRTRNVNFYHFGGKSTKNTDVNTQENNYMFSERERLAIEQFRIKWKKDPFMNPLTFSRLK